MSSASEVDAASAQRVLHALSEAVQSIATGSSLDDVLLGLVDAAKDLAEATYAAIGIPEPEGEAFSRFLTVGMSDALMEAIGPLPRTHGLLAAMLVDPRPYRTEDIRQDPRYRGWPPAHPDMRSFLGVPIVSRGDVIGAFYLTDKCDGSHFSARDEQRVALLAGHAAIAIENARLFEDSRELALVEERNRLAQELHDSMNQTLFSLSLTAETAGRLVAVDPEQASDEIRHVQSLTKALMAELRAAVTGLQPADLERDGLVATLAAYLEVLRRAHGIPISFAADGEPQLDPDAEQNVLRIAQEAVANAIRHAEPSEVTVVLESQAGDLVLVVADDGAGFDPTERKLRTRRLGLTSMQARARNLGGKLEISSNAGGGGTTVRLEIKDG